jgi:hypothetical protein
MGWSSGGGAQATTVANDTIWDTKGDLSVATAADTAAKLAAGTSITSQLIADSATTTGLAWIPHIVRRTANSSAKQNNTLANDDTLLWAVAANEIWFFEAYLIATAINTTMDIKFGWSVPASTTMSWGMQASGIASGGTGYGTPVVANAPVAILTAAGTLSSGTFAGTAGYSLAGVVVVSSTAGNVNLQWAQDTTNANDLILNTNSFLRLTRLA